MGSKKLFHIGLSLAGIVILGLLGACSSSDDGDAAAPAATAAPTTVAKPKVERLVVGVIPPGTEGNAPGRDYSSPTAFQVRPMYEYLIGIDKDTAGFIPELATSWSLEPDGKSLRLQLREGVQFQGGWGEFTAKDVAHTLADITNEDSQHGYSRVLRGLVERVEVVNDHEVVFHNARADADFLTPLSAYEGSMEIQSKDHFDQAGRPTLLTSPIAGTGVYQYVGRTQSVNVLFEQVPYDHWRWTPDFREFEYKWMSETSTRLAALLAGEIHMTQIPTDLHPTATQAGMQMIEGKVRVLRSFLSTLCCFIPDDEANVYDQTDSPLMDVRVRRALNQAIDRDALNDAFFAGKGAPMYLTHFNPDRPGWNPRWQERYADEYGYDPEVARALLSEAGYSAGNQLETNMFITDTSWYDSGSDIGESIVGYWQDVGVKVNSIVMDPAARSAGTRALEFRNHFIVGGTTGGPILSLWVYNSSHHRPGHTFEMPELNDIFVNIRTEFDSSKQDDLFREFGNVMFEQHSQVPLFWLPVELAINPEVLAQYDWCGCVAGIWSHFGGLKAAS